VEPSAGVVQEVPRAELIALSARRGARGRCASRSKEAMLAARSTRTGTANGGKRGAEASEVHGKRVVFDAETWNALDLLARESMKDFQELADEAFRDLLRKHGRPTDLKSALRQSAAQPPARKK
jgi:hypothetical protein